MSTPPRNLKFKIPSGFAVVLCSVRIPTFKRAMAYAKMEYFWANFGLAIRKLKRSLFDLSKKTALL